MVPKGPHTIPKHVRTKSEEPSEMSPNQVPNSSEISQKYDNKQLPAVPGIEPGTLRIRLPDRIRVPAHWPAPAPSAPTIDDVDAEVLMLEVNCEPRDKNAPQ